MTDYLQDIGIRYPALAHLKDDIKTVVDLLLKCYQDEGTIYTCGNGGSAADSEHMVAEIMKGFRLKRRLTKGQTQEIAEVYPDEAMEIAQNLEQSIPAISLVSNSALLTAFANDVDPDYIFAQQIFGLGKQGDILVAISTSGNSVNVVNAAKVALARKLKVIALTGEGGGKLKEHASITIHAPSNDVARIQEYHLPIYHCICSMIEDIVFSET